MDFYSKTAMERAMKIQEVILRAFAKKITWWQAPEVRQFLRESVRPTSESPHRHPAFHHVLTCNHFCAC